LVAEFELCYVGAYRADEQQDPTGGAAEIHR